MISLFLRTFDAPSLTEALEAAGLMIETDKGRIPSQASHTHALDIIGALPGKAGYHANLKVTGEPHPALASVTIAAPDNPMRVWA